jgi:hypothetical protein
MEYYSAINKKNFAEKWMELEIITLSEISQTQTNIPPPFLSSKR